MASLNPKKAALQSAASDSYSKAGAEMKKAQPLLAQPAASQGKLAKVDHADKKGRKTL